MAISSYVVNVSTTQIEIVRGYGAESFVALTNTGPNEVYLGGANDEVQNIALTGGPTGGTFTLTYSGQTTAAIAFDADAEDVEDALDALSNVADGEVEVSEGNDGLPSGFVSVRFQAAKGGTQQPAITGSGAGLTGGSSPGVSITTVQGGGVDSTSSFSLANGASLNFEIKGGDVLYGICSGGESAAVHVLRIG